MPNKYLFAISFVFLTIFPINVFADVVINGTRIVFDAKEKESVIQLKNNGKDPYLLQMWMDDGDPKSKPGDSHVPFVLMPPVVRIEPGKGQAVRIMATNPTLPQDRETLYWFNMLEIPPKPTSKVRSGQNIMQLAFRTRIKFFYRPENQGTTPLEAYKNVKVTLQGNKLQIQNSSPYFITFKNLYVRKDKTSPILASVDKFTNRMVEPKGTITFTLNKSSSNLKGAKLFYSVINDYGGETTNEQEL